MRSQKKTNKSKKVMPDRGFFIGLSTSKTIKALMVILPLIFIAGVIYILAFSISSVVRVDSVELIGNEHLTDEEIRQLGELKPDDNLFMISSKKLYARLKESPWIQSVTIRKIYPSRLQIMIKETEPFALLDMKGKMFIVDEKGRLLEELKENSVPFLPVILSDPYNEKDAFHEAISLARTIKAMGLLGKKERIEIIAHKLNEISTNLDGMVVKIGAGEYEDKLARLIESEEEIKKRNIPVAFIDLRFAKKLIIKPVNEVVR